MNRRFLAVSRAAAEAIAADRFLQSCEFDQGRELASLLTNNAQDTLPTFPHILAVSDSEGLCFVSRKTDRSDAIVFDLEACPLFTDTTEDEALFILQRTLRFALRYWSKQKFTASERTILNTTKGLLFPFPISTRSSYRILVECSPDASRLSRRPPARRATLGLLGREKRPSGGD